MLSVVSAMNDEISAIVMREREGKSEAEKDSVWIKLNVAFREEFLAKLKGPRLSVFLCVALHIDEDFKARPSIEKISKETGYERKAVMRAVRWLEAEGLLSVKRDTPRPKQLGRKANRYKLLHFAAYGEKHSPSNGPRLVDHSPSEDPNHSPSKDQTRVPLEGLEVEPTEAEPIKKNQQQQAGVDEVLKSLGLSERTVDELFSIRDYGEIKQMHDCLQEYIAEGWECKNPAGAMIYACKHNGSQTLWEMAQKDRKEPEVPMWERFREYRGPEGYFLNGVRIGD